MSKIMISFLCVCLFSGLLLAQNPQDSDGCELKTFLDEFAKKTQKYVIYDSTIKGRKIFLGKIPWDKPEELHRLFLSVLEYNGYIVEVVGEKSEFWKIKRNIQGPWTQTSVISSIEELNKIKDQDQFVTMVIALKHISAKEIQIALRALRMVNPQGGNLVAIEGAETILITDYAPNVKRIYEVIQNMEQKIEKEDSLIPLEGQTISLPLEKDVQIFLTIYDSKNSSVVFSKQDGNVITHLDEGKQCIKLNLNPFIKESALFHFNIQVLNTGVAECNIRVEAKHDKETNNLWAFSLSRFLKKRKTISFSLHFQNKN